MGLPQLKNLKGGLGLALALAMAAALATGCAGASAGVTTDIKTKTVAVVTTAATPHTGYLSYKGFVTARETKTAAFVQPGTVKEIFAAEGQTVKKGERLAILDTDAVGIAVDAAKVNEQKVRDSYDAGLATLYLTQRQTQDMYDKSAALYEAGAISEKDFQDLADGLETIENEIRKTEGAYASDLEQIALSLRQYDLQLEYSVLEAPIDGLVTSVIAQENQVAGAGTPAFVLVSEDRIVKIGVSIDDVGRLQVGQALSIEVSGASVPGKIGKIAQYPDQDTRTYTVEIAPDTGNLALGAIADVSIPFSTRNAVLIPLGAVVASEGVNFVYTVETNESGENRIVRREVLLGAPSGADVEALNLEPGLLIVSDDVKNVKENDLVAVQEKGI
jgi:RND family efflux transporter MFP subunit